MLTEHLYWKGRDKNSSSASSGHFSPNLQGEYGNNLTDCQEASACGACFKKIKDGSEKDSVRKYLRKYSLESIQTHSLFARYCIIDLI